MVCAGGGITVDRVDAMPGVRVSAIVVPGSDIRALAVSVSVVWDFTACGVIVTTLASVWVIVVVIIVVCVLSCPLRRSTRRV